MKIMVVSDNRLLRLAVAHALGNQDWRVIEAEDGRRALQMLSADTNVSAVLLSWEMAVMNGFETLVALRSDPGLASIRVIVLTADNRIPSLKKALGAGADDCLILPFTDDMLVNKVKDVMGRGE